MPDMLLLIIIVLSFLAAGFAFLDSLERNAGDKAKRHNKIWFYSLVLLASLCGVWLSLADYYKEISLETTFSIKTAEVDGVKKQFCILADGKEYDILKEFGNMYDPEIWELKYIDYNRWSLGVFNMTSKINEYKIVRKVDKQSNDVYSKATQKRKENK